MLNITTIRDTWRPRTNIEFSVLSAFTKLLIRNLVMTGIFYAETNTSAVHLDTINTITSLLSPLQLRQSYNCHESRIIQS